MARYLLAAAGLRLFSIRPETRRAYRFLGNLLGQRRRAQSAIPSHYIDTAACLIGQCRDFQLIQSGDRLLEVGTGWVHWGATVLRLFYDVQITLFDVWDNRQFAAYKRFCAQLQQVIDRLGETEPTQREELYKRLDTILAVDAFDELYRTLGFAYVVDPTGTLKRFGSESFNGIVSINVLEHLERGILPEFVRDSFRVLEPGGFSVHQIDLTDHLRQYDRSVSCKNYYRYSEQVWNRWFENRVQHFNRVQRSEWLTLFSGAGFELVAENHLLGDLGGIKIHRRYADLSREDRECMLLRMIHKKPLQAKASSL